MVLGYGFRFRIGDINDVIPVDEDAAGPAELRPLVDEVAVLIEYLDAVVAAVAEEQPAVASVCGPSISPGAEPLHRRTDGGLTLRRAIGRLRRSASA
jgi:hypothetical protein